MTPVPAEPVHLVEDSSTGDRLLIYGTDKGIKIELRYDGDTLWITQAHKLPIFLAGMFQQYLDISIT